MNKQKSNQKSCDKSKSRKYSISNKSSKQMDGVKKFASKESQTAQDYMALAIAAAHKSIKSADVPVGAVVVCDGIVIAKSHNKRNKTGKVIDHAEIIALTKANKKMRDFRLNNCEIYVTKEPCLMCMGALLSARISKIYYGASDLRFGTAHLAGDNKFNHKCEIIGGVLKDDCEKLLTDFFRKLRQ